MYNVDEIDVWGLREDLKYEYRNLAQYGGWDDGEIEAVGIDYMSDKEVLEMAERAGINLSGYRRF